MHVRGIAIALLAVCPWVAAAGPTTAEPTTTVAAATSPTPTAASRPATTAVAVGHPPFPADAMTLTAASARVWDQGSLNVAELSGPVRIDLGTAQLTADSAVVWLRPAAPGGGRPVDLVLLGHVSVTLDKITYSYDRYWVPAIVTGRIRLVGPLTALSDERSATYRAAVALLREQRPAATMATTTAAAATGPAVPTTTAAPAPPPDVVPLPPVGPGSGTALPVRLLQADFQTFDRERTADGDLAYVCNGDCSVHYRDVKGNLLEFLAADMVLFTDVKDTRDATGGGRDAVGEHVVAGYFEGDVRVFTTPVGGNRNELRMRAQRVYYEFATDRAVMDDVVFHTTDARKGVPVFMRASAVRQLSQGEYKAEGVELSTSAFATPTYGLSAAHAYVRSEDSGDPRIGERIAYTADNVTLNAFGVPVIYVPQTSGTMTARGAVFRGFSTEDDNQFGFGLRTDWGLFETLGVPTPEHVDADYMLDYYSSRGPGAGLNLSYNAGDLTDESRRPENVAGDLHSFFIDDHGTDVLGYARRNETPPDEFRGRLRYENEWDLGTDLTAQVRLGYDSDSNFLPEYFPDEYQNGLPVDESVYLKHQHGSEVATFLAEGQPNRVVTTADAEQANREVSHLPELEYQRVGDSVLSDRLTFFSDDDAAGEKFVRSEQSIKQQGFYDVVRPGASVFAHPEDFGSPGRPAYAYTGDPGDTTYRGDSRQEVDYPINLGVVHVVPYVFGRYTVYSQGVVPPLKPSPFKSLPPAVTIASDQNRLMGGGGVRLTTDFWRVDDAVHSDLFDLHRLRHVITPEVTLFASGQTVDQDRLFIYDPSRDALNDVQAAQVALRQRWQTKRGGPGHWRSVDFFSLDLYANLFANQPAPRFRDPEDFRSVFLASEPEYSIPRNTANVDATWRISDTTALLASAVENLDYDRLATADVGLAVTRGDRLTYFLGNRYIADLDSNVVELEVSYKLDRKYTLGVSENVDLDQGKNVFYTASITRQFDNFSASVNAHYDQTTNDEGFGFSLSPNGLARGLGSNQLQQQQAP